MTFQMLETVKNEAKHTCKTIRTFTSVPGQRTSCSYTFSSVTRVFNTYINTLGALVTSRRALAFRKSVDDFTISFAAIETVA